MFCGKCGVKNADDATFCTGCGAKLNEVQASFKTTTIVASSNDKNRKVGIIAVAVIAIVVIGIIIALFGGRSYKATVEKFVDAQFDADAEAIFELIPKEMIDYIWEEEGYNDDEFDEFIKEGNEALQNQLDYIERYLGEDWDVTYTILNTEDVTGDDLDDLKDDYEDIDIKVSAAKVVEIELTVKAGETETSNSLDVSVIKVGRSWYLDLESMGSIF